MIELVHDGGAHLPGVQAGLELAADTLSRSLPAEQIRIRAFDSNELDNLRATTLPDGVVDLREFVIHQVADRSTFHVPNNHRMTSVITARACVIEDGRRIDRPYGYGVGVTGEAAVSTDSITSKTPAQLESQIGLLIAYTAVHETGHLFGLVKPEAKRHQTGKHCGNICVMRSTVTPVDTWKMIGAMGGRICFCADCSRDLRVAQG